MQLFRCFIRSGSSQIRYFFSFDKNHIQNLLKAQQNVRTSQNMNQWVDYQIQLSNAYSIFPQDNQKICSQSIFHKLLAVKYGMGEGIKFDQNIIDTITQDNIHAKLIYQNYQNQEHPQGYDQNYNDLLLQEQLRIKFLLKQSKHIDRFITKEEFKEWKESLQRSIKYKQVNAPNDVNDEISSYLQLVEYYTGILLQAEQTGVFYESFEELFKTLDIVDKGKLLIKQEDPNHRYLMQYEARVCAHLSKKLVSINLPLCLELLERAIITYEKLNMEYDLQYIIMYKFYCNHNLLKYDLISKTLKLQQYFKTIDNKYKNLGYQNMTILLFHQQVMQNSTESANEIRQIIQKDNDVLNYDDFRLISLINIYIDAFGQKQSEYKHTIEQYKTFIAEFLNFLALFISNIELKQMSVQIKKANLDSKELNSVLFLLNGLFTETNQYYPYIAQDKQIWNYLISLFKLCFQDLNSNYQMITEITLQTIKYCVSDAYKYEYIITLVYTQLKLLKYLKLRDPFNEIKTFLITQVPQHQLKNKFNELSME